MPNLQKSLLTFGAGLMSAWVELRLKRSAIAGQERALRWLLRHLALTEQGRACGLTARTTATEFARAAPPRAYESLKPQLARMQRGEADVLWPGECACYAATAGTTTGRPKHLPVTPAMLAHFRRAGCDALFYYTQRIGHAGIFQGRQLYLSGSTALKPIRGVEPFQAWTGHLAGILANHLSPWAQKHLYEPQADLANLTDWPARLRAIAKHTQHRDISLLAGCPDWLLNFAIVLRQHAKRGPATPLNLQAVWPNLECILHGGAPVGPFLDDLRAAAGPTVNFHEVYSAAEGVFAAQDADSALGLRLIADAGVYYEFIPLADFDETRLDQLGAKAVPLAGVKPGVNYVMLVTTPAGLCRHLVGDVVRFVGTQPPRLLCVGRTNLRLNARGEDVSEKNVTDALLKVCHDQRWRIVDFHVAPMSTSTLTGPQRGRHEWWIELRPGTVATPTGPALETALDAELQRLNDDYAARRKIGELDAPLVRLVMPGIFEQWLRAQGKLDGQYKMPRCRGDRAIADALAQIARFTTQT